MSPEVSIIILNWNGLEDTGFLDIHKFKLHN